MWNLEKNVLSPNYIVIKNDTTDLHFYVTGLDTTEVENVANAVQELMNVGKKSKLLKKNILLDEIVILQNGIKIGAAGTIKKTKVEEQTDNNNSMINYDRIEFLKELVKKF